MTLKIYPKTQLLSAALGLSCLVEGSCRALADNISELYPLNFYDYQQPDAVCTGNTVSTLYAFVGGAFYPSSIRKRSFQTFRFLRRELSDWRRRCQPHFQATQAMFPMKTHRMFRSSLVKIFRTTRRLVQQFQPAYP
jgi:hypothetical protein